MQNSNNRADCKKELLQKQFAVLRASVEEGLKVTVPAGVAGLNRIRIVHLIESGGNLHSLTFTQSLLPLVLSTS